MEKQDTERDFGADLVRITAGVLVLTVHFFLRNGFYYREARGFFGVLAVAFRTAALNCVPLFMMLTGYLKCKKEWTLRSYLSIVPILTSYVVISLIHLAYKILYAGVRMSAIEWLLQLISFKLADYSW
ncbi:MAG: hypothetical protein IJM50_06995 [Lachnospiraceae bacterium]|nr:hypothetical protein [Lachnospiraceae bacterium]